jgi:hypothetical protein
MGLHLQPCHEFLSVLDPGSPRAALEFKQVMDATPEDLKKWPTNIYSQIAIALKGGELREVGLANLAGRLAIRVPKPPTAADSAAAGNKSSIRILTRTASSKASCAVKRLRKGIGVECDVRVAAERTGSASWRRTPARLTMLARPWALEPNASNTSADSTTRVDTAPTVQSSV